MTATTARASAARDHAARSRPGGRPAEHAPGRDHAEQRRRDFRVLGQRELAERARRRRVGRLATASAGVLVAALLTVAGAQALVASRQVRIDALQQRLASAVATDQQLEVRRASLEAPSRILEVAQRRLRMVSPGTVSYLAPVDPGPDVASTAASVPVPPATVPVSGAPVGATGNTAPPGHSAPPGARRPAGAAASTGARG